MPIIKVPLYITLDYALQGLDLPPATYNSRFTDESAYCCTVRYFFRNSAGEQIEDNVVGLSPLSSDEAKSNAANSALDHLKTTMNLTIVDYNYRDLEFHKIAFQASVNQDRNALNRDVNALRTGIQILYAEYTSLADAIDRAMSGHGRVTTQFSSSSDSD